MPTSRRRTIRAPTTTAAKRSPSSRRRGRSWCSKGHPATAPRLRRRCATAAWRSRSSRRPSSRPARTSLDRFDGIALANVAATQLTLDQQRTLQRFVQDMGRGLFVAGGNTSYALGGYQGSVLDEMLPVSPAPPPRRDDEHHRAVPGDRQVRQHGPVPQRRLEDGDGPRGGDPLGRGAPPERHARRARLRQPLRLGRQADRRSRAAPTSPTPRRRSSRIKADGGTSIYPALEEAYKAAAASDARLKHIILLTDGQSFDADYPALIAKMQADADHPLDHRGRQRLRHQAADRSGPDGRGPLLLHRALDRTSRRSPPARRPSPPAARWSRGGSCRR